MIEWVLITVAIAYLIPGFILLSRRPEGANLSGEAAVVTLLWPFFIARKKRPEDV